MEAKNADLAALRINRSAEPAAGVIASALIFAVVMGLVGGVLPAARAARLNIVNALRAS